MALAIRQVRAQIVRRSPIIGPLVEPLESRRLFAAGDLDFAWGDRGRVWLPALSNDIYGFANDIAYQNGKAVVGGYYDAANAPLGRLGFVARYNNDGSPDTSFNGTGCVLNLSAVASLALQPHGKIVASGDGSVFRLNQNGHYDQTFGKHGKVSVGSVGTADLELMPDGRIVVGGSARDYQPSAARLNADGSFDPSFGVNGRVFLPERSIVEHLLVQPDGKVLLAGTGYNLVDDSEFNYSGDDCALWRLTAGGKLDPSFGKHGLAGFSSVSTYSYEVPGDIALRPDGKILFASIFDEDTVLMRLVNPDGTEASMQYDTFTVGYPSVEKTLLGPDGSVIAIGYQYGLGFQGEYEDDIFTYSDSYIVKWDADGSIDHTFGINGLTAFSSHPGYRPTADGTAGTLTPDGNLLIAGSGGMLTRRLLLKDEFRVALGNDGTLTLEGDNRSERFVIRAIPAGKGKPARVRVTSHGQTVDFNRDDVKKIYIEAGAGDDTIIADAFGIPAKVFAGDGNDIITGGSGDDVIDAGAGNNRVDGRAGNDHITSGGGADVLRGGAGNDVLDAGDGRDRIIGGKGRDLATYAFANEPLVIRLGGKSGNGRAAENDFIAADVEGACGGFGDDMIYGTEGPDILIGGYGHDQIFGGKGNDVVDADGVKLYDFWPMPPEEEEFAAAAVSTTGGVQRGAIQSAAVADDLSGSILWGGPGDDVLFAGSYDTQLHGGTGNDVFYGRDSEDEFWGDAGDDFFNAGFDYGSGIYHGGEGVDTISYATNEDGGITVTLDGVKNDGVSYIPYDNVMPDVENIFGTAFDDTLIGSAANNVINGGAGNDTIDGGAGVDKLFGAAGNDLLRARDGFADVVDGGSGSDSAFIDLGEQVVSVEKHSF